MQILALADDLSGALEVGAKFAQAGIPATVVCANQWHDAEGVLVVDTETRHLPAAEAGAVVGEICGLARCHPIRLIYKKTDSTLRGNIGAELAAVVAAYPEFPLVYVPAYPQMGRTVKNGQLLVNGVPVSQTEFACDPLNPVSDSQISTLLESQGLNPALVRICDAGTVDEIERIASAFLRAEGTLCAAGPAAFAEAIACKMGHATPRIHPALRRCLVVNGSLHPLSARQVEAFRGPTQWSVFDHGNVQGQGAARARSVGRRVRDLLEESPFDGLVVFGGDTAHGILEALGFPVLRPLGEIVPGVPVSQVLWGRRELCFITKAGGFGPVDVLASIHNLLSGSHQA